MIFIEKKGDYMPKLSSLIGGLCNELDDIETRNSFVPTIVEVCIIAPKTYALKIQIAENEYVHIVKCKGLQLSNENLSKVNMQTMKSYLLGKNYTQIDKEYICYAKVEKKSKRFLLHKLMMTFTLIKLKQEDMVFLV